MNRRVLLAVLIAWGVCPPAAPAVELAWARFRGPNGSGVAADSAPLPTRWSPTENLKWKTLLPGPGSSSPIVVGDRVYVTCWSGYGTDDSADADQESLRRHLVAIDRSSGQIVWKSTVAPDLPEDEYGGMFAQHGYASHTPVSDGERIYAYFGKSGAIAYDLSGKQLWQTKLGAELDPHGWGSASSPILYKNLLIVTASAESEALVALDTATGAEVWRQEAAGFNGTWGTPVLVNVEEDRTELVIGIPGEIWGFQPDTGKLLWYCQGIDENSFCSSVVPGEGVVYAVEGRSGGSLAVRAGGRGDVTDSHVVWRGRDRNRIGTPLLWDGRLYFFNSGLANCLDAATGKEIFQERLTGTSGGNQGGGRSRWSGDYASAVAADGKIFYVARSGDAFVLAAEPTFRQLAVNRLTEDAEDFSATPAVSGQDIFIRSSKHLYCVAQQ